MVLVAVLQPRFRRPGAPESLVKMYTYFRWTIGVLSVYPHPSKVRRLYAVVQAKFAVDYIDSSSEGSGSHIPSSYFISTFDIFILVSGKLRFKRSSVVCSCVHRMRIYLDVLLVQGRCNSAYSSTLVVEHDHEPWLMLALTPDTSDLLFNELGYERERWTRFMP